MKEKKEEERASTSEVKRCSEKIKEIKKEMARVVVGQDEIIDGLICAILCGGHALVEGVPGIAKTLVIRALAQATGCLSKRIQFTVDLLPADIIGITSYTPGKGFEIIKGPLFANFVIADEINRSPSKCVLGSTPILCDNGEIINIKEIIKNYSGKTIKKDNEYWMVPKKPLKLMALNLKDYKIKSEEVKYLYKQKTKNPYHEIILKTGRKIKTSTVHPFFTLRNGRVEMIKAEELKKGDCVLVPGKLNINEDNNLNYQGDFVKESGEVIKEIERRKTIYENVFKYKQKGLNEKEIIKTFSDTDFDLIKTFLKSKPNYLSINRDLFFSKSKQFGQISAVKMPVQVTKELAQFIAILIAEGNVNNRYFYLTMKEKEVPELFINLADNLFGIKASLLYDNKRKQYRVAFGSDALVKLLKSLGYNPHLKSREKEIPGFILKSGNENITEFLKMYYECDGCVSRDCVKVTTKSKKIANFLSYLLLRLGLVAKIGYDLSKTKIGNYQYERRFYNLRLYGAELCSFFDRIGFFSHEKNMKLRNLIRSSDSMKTDLISGMHSMIRAIRKLSGITHREFYEETQMYAHNLENPNNSLMHSRTRLGRITGLLNANNYLVQQLGKIVDSDFCCDFVKENKIVIPKKEYWLYDFSMNENHSFIAGFGGIISHNTQSALLEAMQERQVTIGKTTFPLPKPFFVMANENPLETSGVYPLPEAQVDRFLFKILMTYPKMEEEDEIMQNNVSLKKFEDFGIKAVSGPDDLIEMNKIAKRIYLSKKVRSYILRIVESTRAKDFENARYIDWGASPRASISLFIGSKAKALMQGRNFVIPKDVKDVAYDVLRHRLILSYKARAQGITAEKIIKEILERTKVP